MKKRDKIFIIVPVVIVAVALLFVGLSFYFLFGSYTKSTDDISYYMALCGETDGETCLPILGSRSKIDIPYNLPKQDYLDSCLDYRFDYTAKKVLIFESHAYIIICEFSKDSYIYEKSNLNSRYPFLKADTQGLQTYLQTEFELDSFSFNAVYGNNYPKDMLFIGCSDATNEIAYIYYHDMDLDSLPSNITNFIRKETGWDNVVN